MRTEEEFLEELSVMADFQDLEQSLLNILMAIRFRFEELEPNQGDGK